MRYATSSIFQRDTTRLCIILLLLDLLNSLIENSEHYKHSYKTEAFSTPISPRRRLLPFQINLISTDNNKNNNNVSVATSPLFLSSSKQLLTSMKSSSSFHQKCQVFPWKRIRKNSVTLYTTSSSKEDDEEHKGTASTSFESVEKKKRNKSKRITLIRSIISILCVSTSILVWNQRYAVGEFLDFIKNEWLMKTLDGLNDAGPLGLALYTIVFMIWEMTAGITTPVETAAGMVFGPIKGIVANGTGKLLGALSAFLLARYAYKSKVQEAMMDGKYEILDLVKESISERPLQVALLCRFSPLPELMKNAGLGVMPSLKTRYFVASLILHGFSFTCLWTCMGAETARVLRGYHPPSNKLKLLVSGATWIGFGAPVLIGIWIKSLKDKQQQRQQRKAEE